MITAKELAQELLKHPDFAIKVRTWKNNNLTDFKIKEITDIGYSDKIFVLSGEEE